MIWLTNPLYVRVIKVMLPFFPLYDNFIKYAKAIPTGDEHG